MSSCSKKVRLVLEEKNIRWTGHHMNLRKGETRTKSYGGSVGEGYGKGYDLDIKYRWMKKVS